MFSKKESNQISSWAPTLATTVFLLIFTISAHNQLLPLRQAKVIFSEEDLYINQGPCPENKDVVCDYIVPTIKNVGEAEAKNIRFIFYAIPFDDIKFSSGYMLFDDGIVHDLYPGAVAKFGTNFIPHKTNDGKDLVGRKVALICLVNYKDSITEKEDDRYFLFNYVIGNDEISSLLWDDYDKIKIRIKENIKNTKFIEFIEEKASVRQDRI